jgi:hypothetical protein
VVLVGKAPAGPAEVGDFNVPQGRDYIVPDPPGIGDRSRSGGIVSDPVSAVDTAAQVFGKMSVNMTADPDIAVLGFDYNSVHTNLPYKKHYEKIVIRLYNKPIPFERHQAVPYRGLIEHIYCITLIA